MKWNEIKTSDGCGSWNPGNHGPRGVPADQQVGPTAARWTAGLRPGAARRSSTVPGGCRPLRFPQRVFRWTSAVFFALAVAGMALLLAFDIRNHLAFTPMHQRTGAISLMLIGAAYISLQLGSPGPAAGTLRKILLGVGFLLWGGEQFMAANPWLTAMDSAVVLIFVSDLGLVIVEHLRRSYAARRQTEFLPTSGLRAPRPPGVEAETRDGKP